MEPDGGDAGVQPNFGALQKPLWNLGRSLLKLEDVPSQAGAREDTRSANALSEPSWL